MKSSFITTQSPFLINKPSGALAQEGHRYGLRYRTPPAFTDTSIVTVNRLPAVGGSNEFFHRYGPRASAEGATQAGNR